MLTISTPLSAGQARCYHEEEFQNARENYYTEGDRIRGVWHGQLADRGGLGREGREEDVERLPRGARASCRSTGSASPRGSIRSRASNSSATKPLVRRRTPAERASRRWSTAPGGTRRYPRR